MRIIFSGGGTLGSVMPLLALYQELSLRHCDWAFLWVGTRRGVENSALKTFKLERRYLPASKWRRPWQWRNLTDLFKLALALARSFMIIYRFKPDLLVSAGGFVSVPLHLAAAAMRKTTLIHQQDARVGLADRIVSRFATFITTALAKNTAAFPKGKALWLGNPVRRAVMTGSRAEVDKIFQLEPDLPTLLILGGGSGALSLNRLIAEIAKYLVSDCQIIHLTGSGKEVEAEQPETQTLRRLLDKRYHQARFLDEAQIAAVYAAADLVITRCGFSTLSELAVLGKPVILAPLPDSHQEENARYFSELSGAPVFVYGRDNPRELVKLIKHLLTDHSERLLIGHKMKQLMPPNALLKMTLLIEEITKTKQPR